MDFFQDAIKCRHCEYVISDTPVLMPCCHSICKKHEQEATVLCYECNTEHEVPKGGFMENKALKTIIASNIVKIDLGPQYKNAKNSCSQLKVIIEDIEKRFNEPENYFQKRKDTLKNKIDLAREELKLKIDKTADELIEKVEDDNSTLNDAKSTINDEQVQASKQDLVEWSDFLDDFKVDCDQYQTIENKCNDAIKKLQKQLDSFEKKLENKFDEIEKLINDFKKNEISTNIKSSTPIKGICYATVDTEHHDLSTLAVLRDGKLALGHITGSISIRYSGTNSQLQVLSGHTKCINYLLELSNRNLASASDDKTIKIWDIENGSELQTLEGHNNHVYVLEQLRNGSLVSWSVDNTIKIWNLKKGIIDTINMDDEIYSLALLKNGNFCCLLKSKLVILDPLSKEILQSIQNKKFQRIALLSDGSVAIGQRDSNITIWDVNNLTLLRTLKGHKRSITSLKLLNDGSLASGSEDCEIKIWNPNDGKLLKNIDGKLLKNVVVKKDEIIYCIDQLSNGNLVTLSSECKFWR